MQSAYRHRRGITAVYAILLMVILAAVASLAVDYGRVQLVKTELRCAADAAARAAIANLPNGISQAQDSAVLFAAENKAAGTSVALDRNTDIEFITWDDSTRTYTVLSGLARASANAIRVRARRTAETDNSRQPNPVPLLWASLLGRQTCDVTASAIARAAPLRYGAVGLDYIRMGGNATDSYWSTSGYTAGDHGSIASNGTITLSGNSSIAGDARPGVGSTVVGANHVSGSTAPLTAPLVYPNASAGVYATQNDNLQIPSWAMSATDFRPPSNKTVTLPGGTYCVNDFRVDSNNAVSFTGPTTVYCYGTFTLSGNATTSSDLPGNLKIIMVPNPSTGAPPGGISISSKAALYATIYAPQSAITLSGSGDLYGSVVGKSIDMTGTSAIHYDLTLPGASGTIALVK